MTARTVRPTRRQIAASLAFYGGQPMPAPSAPRQPSARPEADVLRAASIARQRPVSLAQRYRLLAPSTPNRNCRDQRVDSR